MCPIDSPNRIDHRPYIDQRLIKIYKDCFQHNIPDGFKAPAHHDEARYPLPTVTFILFTAEDVDDETILAHLKSDVEKVGRADR